MSRFSTAGPEAMVRLFVAFGIIVGTGCSPELPVNTLRLSIGIENADSGEAVYVSGLQEQSIRAEIEAGHLTLVRPLSHAQRTSIQLPESAGNERITLYVEPGDVRLQVTPRSSGTGNLVTITGSASQSLFESYQAVLEEGRPDFGGERHRPISDRARRAEHILMIAQSHLDSIVTRDVIASFLRSSATVNVPMPIVGKLHALLRTHFPDFDQLDLVDEAVAVHERRQPGQLLAGLAFLGRTTTGGPIRLLDNLGDRYTLVELWASWCIACRDEFPHLVGVEESYRARGFAVFAISHDTDEDRWVEAIDKDDIGAFTHGSQLSGIENEITNAYGIRGIPANFLIDSEGTIVGSDLFGAVLDARLTELYEGTQRQDHP